MCIDTAPCHPAYCVQCRTAPHPTKPHEDTMKAAARRNIEARKATVRTHTSKVMTWCMGKCNAPTQHTETIVGQSFGFMGVRTCDTCGHNKDAGR